MKIAHISPYDMHRPGGVQSHIYALAKEFMASGHTVTIVCPASPRHTATSPFTVPMTYIGKCHPLDAGGTTIDLSSISPRDETNFITFLDHGHFDIVHFHEPWMPFLLPELIRLTTDTPKVGTFYATPSEGPLSKLWYNIVSSYAAPTISAIDSLVTISESSLANLRKYYAGPVSMIPCGVDTDIFKPKRPVPLASRSHPPVFSILFLGRLDDRKGALYLIKAFELLSKNKLPMHLVIAGEGRNKKKLMRYAADRELHNIEFTGYVDEKHKPAMYASADVFCAPSLYGESFGIVLLEAMACGVPTIATDIPGYRAVIKGAGEKLLVRPRNEHDIADVIMALWKDAALRKQMRQWGLKRVKLFSWGKIAAMTMAVYEKTLHDQE